MEAHEVKYGTRVKVIDKNVNIPPASVPVKQGDIIKILGIDGMYCKGKDAKGDIVYIAAWTDVEYV